PEQRLAGRHYYPTLKDPFGCGPEEFRRFFRGKTLGLLDASFASDYNEVDFGRGMAVHSSPPPQCQVNPSQERTMSYGYDYSVAARAASSDRALFIRRTYAHLAGAILAFMGIEAFLLNVLTIEQQNTIFRMMGGYGWLVVMLAFMGASWLAQTWAQSDSSPGIQYLGLGLYVVAEAVIFLPLLIIAERFI